MDFVQKPDFIATDVDGTLLNRSESITLRTCEVIQAAILSNTTFVLATGRPPRWILPIVENLGFAPIAICANGSVVYDSYTGHIVLAHTFLYDLLEEIIEIVTYIIPDAELFVEQVGNSISESSTLYLISKSSSTYHKTKAEKKELFLKDIAKLSIIKLLIYKQDAKSADIINRLSKYVKLRASITYSINNGLVEVVPLYINKATGITQFIKYTKLSIKKSISFGDMPNDIPMLKWASVGVAMRNSHSKVIKIANEITSSNYEDGVAVMLERWWN